MRAGTSRVSYAASNVAVTLMDGRKYTQTAQWGKWLPGLLSFSAGGTDAANLSATVDAVSGDVLLIATSVVAEAFTVVAVGMGGKQLRRVTKVPCNVDAMEPGDVDLGQADGLALPAVDNGSPFDLDVRVNTGDSILGAFDLVVWYDPGAVGPAGVATTSGSNAAVRILPGVRRTPPPRYFLIGWQSVSCFGCISHYIDYNLCLTRAGTPPLTP